jgi:cbb3-type cytochrome oxidase subunit 3
VEKLKCHCGLDPQSRILLFMYSVITKKFKFIVFSFILVFSFLMVVQVGLAVDPKDDNYGLNPTAINSKLATKAQIDDPNRLSTIIGTIVGAALSFLGVVFFILIIYGGYMWMFSMGNEQTAGKAKDIIIAAVIGLVIVLMAYAITTFISGAIGT